MEIRTLIIGFLFGIIGAFFGSWFNYLFSERRRQREEFNNTATALLAEIDSVIENRSRMNHPTGRDFAKDPLRKMGVATYHAFKVTLNKTDAAYIEEAYQNCDKDYPKTINLTVFRDAIIKIHDR
ncbi:MAG: hypothetical protein HY739_13480 [Desulfobacterales bacterium]|nr:hypothetical protein [Desulfobacterales bacterium]